MASQNLTFVLRNNLMDYTVLILDTDVKEEEVTGVPPKKPTRRSSRHGGSQLISTLNVWATVTDTEEADFVVAKPEEEPTVCDTYPPTKKLKSSGRLALEN